MLELRLLSRELSAPFARFLRALANDPAAARFHPHPFTEAEAQARCEYSGLDIYSVLVRDGEIAAYGMLRGWDEGFAVPSLGIAVAPDDRGLGYGGLMMRYLHAAAKDRGADKIRLKVYPDNASAVAMYRKLGYQFEPELQHEQFVGFLTL